MVVSLTQMIADADAAPYGYLHHPNNGIRISTWQGLYCTVALKHEVIVHTHFGELHEGAHHMY